MDLEFSLKNLNRTVLQQELPFLINLADTPTKETEGNLLRVLTLCPLSPFVYLPFLRLRCLFLSYNRAKILKTQNSLSVVVEKHQGQQENELRSDTSG
ncbi:hypothetical protein A4S05_09935 [Nostoc sp. KVJ20]|nr:hypothetical protein A4S05_09935 [Nostoc sp. KVJ20]